MLKAPIRLAVALAFLLLGMACIGFRTVEYVIGGFVVEANVIGMHFIVVDLLLVPVGIVAMIVGSLLLWRRSRR